MLVDILLYSCRTIQRRLFLALDCAVSHGVCTHLFLGEIYVAAGPKSAKGNPVRLMGGGKHHL